MAPPLCSTIPSTVDRPKPVPLPPSLERIQLVRQNREQATQTLCFNSRPFVLCGLPVRRLPKDQLLYERRNGRFVNKCRRQQHFGDRASSGSCSRVNSVPISLHTQE